MLYVIIDTLIEQSSLLDHSIHCYLLSQKYWSIEWDHLPYNNGKPTIVKCSKFLNLVTI